MIIAEFNIGDINQQFVNLVKQLRPRIDSEKECRDSFKKAIKEGLTFFVAQDGDKYIGFISCRLIYNLYLEEFCIIDDLIVDENSRKKGAGRRLMMAVENLCRKKKITTLKLDSGLQRLGTHLFYEKLGYIKKCYTFEKHLR